MIVGRIQKHVCTCSCSQFLKIDVMMCTVNAWHQGVLYDGLPQGGLGILCCLMVIKNENCSIIRYLHVAQCCYGQQILGQIPYSVKEESFDKFLIRSFWWVKLFVESLLVCFLYLCHDTLLKFGWWNLANHQWFAEFAKVFLCQTFSLYGTWNI